ncbi:response regulator [Candidatus Sumerlaeota bacterium]|nr:response regulator [Candidatus Sumerlaeota bacterium]
MPLSMSACYRILIVDDSLDDREIYKHHLARSRQLRYVYKETDRVDAALELCREFHPDCILLDYNLPDGSGLDLLERLAPEFPPHAVSTVMLTGQGNEEIIVQALKMGAADYISKGRISADGLCRIVYRAIEKRSLLRNLHEEQQEKDQLIVELKEALAQVKRLSGLLPICSNCKKVRDDKGYWQQVEVYIGEHSEADFSHGFCPDCMKALYPGIVEKISQKTPES